MEDKTRLVRARIAGRLDGFGWIPAARAAAVLAGIYEAAGFKREAVGKDEGIDEKPIAIINNPKERRLFIHFETSARKKKSEKKNRRRTGLSCR